MKRCNGIPGDVLVSETLIGEALLTHVSTNTSINQRIISQVEFI